MKSHFSSACGRGDVIVLRPRHPAAGGGSPRCRPRSPAGLERRSGNAGSGDESQERPVLNLLGLLFCIALALAGVWMIDQFAEMKRVQDASCQAAAVPFLNASRTLSASCETSTRQRRPRFGCRQRSAAADNRQQHRG